jgi:hypothetical protein
MINANELRIGDIILYDEDNLYCKVLTIDTLGMTVDFMKNGEIEWLEYENFSPIPLAPEILEKCDWNGYKEFYINSDFKIEGNGGIWYCGDFTGIVVKYLHQLQNLYFALTGQELKFNL